MFRFISTMPDVTFVKEVAKKSVSYSFYYNLEAGIYLVVETTILFGDPRPVVVAHELGMLDSVVDFREKNFFWRKSDGYTEVK